MSHHKRFQKHKSRKYRKLHHLPKSKPSEFVLKEDQKTSFKTEKEKSPLEESRLVPQAEETRTDNAKLIHLVSSDFKKVLTIFLGFVILLAVLYLIKIKTSFFNITVDYFFRLFALSQ